MTVSSEVETKFELDENGFERLKSAGRIEKCIHQLNVYFDANWVLANRSITFRVRFTPSSPPEATLKLPVTVDGLTRTMKEIDVPVGQLHDSPETVRLPHRHLDVDKDLPTVLKTEMRRLGLKSLERVGWMRNTRYVIRIDTHGSIELDCTILPDGSTVFEAEIESPDSAVHRKLSQFLLSMVPWAQPSRISKFQRFRRAAEAANSRMLVMSYDFEADSGVKKASDSSESLFMKLKKLLRFGRTTTT